MAYRLTRIYTRTGDAGTTGLGDGSRVPKEGLRIQAIGDLDELNSALGVALAAAPAEAVRALLAPRQHELFDLGGELCLPEQSLLDANYAARLETAIDGLNATLPPLTNFILPGGHPAAAACHLARTVCRRAERSLAALARQERVNPHALAYLNRLSDLLFVAARAQNAAAGVPDPLWQPGPTR